MCCNSSKTEIMIFGPPVANFQFKFNNCTIEPVKKLKVLGIMFNNNLKWTSHISQIIKKASQGNYSLRILKSILPKELLTKVIQSNFLCHFTYGMPIWAGCLTQSDTKRLETAIMKTYRMVCGDFRKLLSNYEVCRRVNLRSFNSLRLLNDAIFLHKLYSEPSNTAITIRMIQQSFYNSRFPDRIHFFDASHKRVGRSSFINRSKLIAETIPFIWTDMSHATFKLRMKNATPLHL